MSVPPPPTAASVEGTASDRAAEYSRRFAAVTDEDARLADVLGAFSEADLVVIHDGGSATVSAEGQAGIPWSTVWSGVLVAPPGVAVPLAQLGRAFAAFFQMPLEEFLDAAVNDLRTNFAKGDFVANLVAWDTARYGADITAESVDPNAVFVSIPTLYIVATSIVQSMLARLAPQQPVNSAAGSASARLVPLAMFTPRNPETKAPFLGEDCGTGAQDGWVQFIGTKIMGGFKTPFGSWDGVVSKVLGGAAAEKIERVLGPANAFLGILSAAVQYGALTADASAKPLERTRSSKSPGNETNIEVTVSYNFKHSKSANKAFNCIQAGLGVFGIGTNLPPTGPVAGADVEFEEGQGFGPNGWVQWWGNNQNLTTDQNGKAFQTVAGQKQPVDIPSSARKIDRTYSVDIKVAIDPDNMTSVDKFTLDGVGCSGSIAAVAVSGSISGAVLGCLDMVMDLLKQINFSLGEREFQGTDWQVGYEVSSALGYPKLTMTGKSCAKEHPERGPWVIEYYSDLPVIGRHSGPPMQLTFVNGTAEFSYELKRGPEQWWTGYGVASLVGGESSGWKIVFDEQSSTYWDGDGNSMDAGGLNVIFPELELKPYVNCPAS